MSDPDTPEAAIRDALDYIETNPDEHESRLLAALVAENAWFAEETSEAASKVEAENDRLTAELAKANWKLDNARDVLVPTFVAERDEAFADRDAALGREEAAVLRSIEALRAADELRAILRRVIGGALRAALDLAEQLRQARRAEANWPGCEGDDAEADDISRISERADDLEQAYHSALSACQEVWTDKATRSMAAALAALDTLATESGALREALAEIVNYDEEGPQDAADVYEHFQAIARAALNGSEAA